jgi:NAD(P)-dependent dehydrogenase (short-subunit alcohol dehydrogenase family)
MPTKQNPVASGFGPATIAKETLHGVDLTGNIAIVTGGYAGIGLESTRALAGAGPTVIVTVRGPEKAHNALRGIQAERPRFLLCV